MAAFDMSGFGDGFLRGFELVQRQRQSDRADREQAEQSERARRQEDLQNQQFGLQLQEAAMRRQTTESALKTDEANRQLAASKDRREQQMMPLEMDARRAQIAASKSSSAADAARIRASRLDEEKARFELDRFKEADDLQRSRARVSAYMKDKQILDPIIARLNSPRPTRPPSVVDIQAITGLITAPERQEVIGKPISKFTSDSWGIPEGSVIGSMEPTPEVRVGGKGDDVKFYPVMRVTTVDPVTKQPNGQYSTTFTANRTGEPDDNVVGIPKRKVDNFLEGFAKTQQMVDSMMAVGATEKEILDAIDDRINFIVNKGRTTAQSLGGQKALINGELVDLGNPAMLAYITQAAKNGDPEAAKLAEQYGLQYAAGAPPRSSAGNPETGESESTAKLIKRGDGSVVIQYPDGKQEAATKEKVAALKQQGVLK